MTSERDLAYPNLGLLKRFEQRDRTGVIWLCCGAYPLSGASRRDGILGDHGPDPATFCGFPKCPPGRDWCEHGELQQPRGFRHAHKDSLHRICWYLAGCRLSAIPLSKEPGEMAGEEKRTSVQSILQHSERCCIPHNCCERYYLREH